MAQSAGFRFILLLTIWVVPARGQGQLPDKTIASVWADDHYWDVGTGPVVVLVHGLGSRKEDWLPVIAPLSQNTDCWCRPDWLRRSDKPLIDLQHPDVRGFLNELLRQLKVEKASFVGESLAYGFAGYMRRRLPAGRI